MLEQTSVKVEGTTFVRDINTMALSNTDFAAKNEYYLKAKLIKTQRDEINNLKADMANIKGDMQDIKNLLVQLMDKGRNG